MADLDQYTALARLAVEETGRGVFEDMVEIAEPVGVVRAFTPVTNPTSTTARGRQPGVSLILATGGNTMVKAAYSAGKPALGVGAGNVPAYVHRSAELRRTVNDLVLSKSFDNGMICASEQAVILDDEIYAAALAEFRALRAHLATAEEKEKLESFLFPGGRARAAAASRGSTPRPSGRARSGSPSRPASPCPPASPSSSSRPNGSVPWSR